MIAPKATLTSQPKSMISVCEDSLELTWKGQIVSDSFGIKRQRPIHLKQLQWKLLGYCKDASIIWDMHLQTFSLQPVPNTSSVNVSAKQGMSH